MPEKRWLSIYFVCCSASLSLFSSLRHAWFQSNAWDLGIFDQAIYLISQGQVPTSTFLNFHILGDHAALALYPIGLIYRRSFYLLLVIQSIAIASCIFLYINSPILRLNPRQENHHIIFHAISYNI